MTRKLPKAQRDVLRATRTPNSILAQALDDLDEADRELAAEKVESDAWYAAATELGAKLAEAEAAYAQSEKLSALLTDSVEGLIEEVTALREVAKAARDYCAHDADCEWYYGTPENAPNGMCDCGTAKVNKVLAAYDALPKKG